MSVFVAKIKKEPFESCKQQLLDLIINKCEAAAPPGPGPGPGALCLCEVGEGARSPVYPCGPGWALGPGAAAEADPDLPPPTEEGGVHVDPGGGPLHLHGGLVWVGL